jgi:hypothetical protein
MAVRVELPADVAAGLDRVPKARERFFALPAERQDAWLSWIDRARGARGREARIDDMIRRLGPPGAVAEEEVVEPAGPPPERYWWLWLLLLLLLLIGGLLAWYFLTRGSDKATVPNVIGLRADAAAARIHDKGLTSRRAPERAIGLRTSSSARSQVRLQGRDQARRFFAAKRPTTNQSKDGLVVEQQPRAGTSIPGGLQVTIFVGRFTG